MPFYEISCTTCNYIVDTFCKYEELTTAPLSCDQCHELMTPIMSVPAYPQFKGSGFYETDLKDKT